MKNENIKFYYGIGYRDYSSNELTGLIFDVGTLNIKSAFYNKLFVHDKDERGTYLDLDELGSFKDILLF